MLSPPVDWSSACPYPSKNTQESYLGFGYGHSYYYKAVEGYKDALEFSKLYPKGYSPRKDVNFLF
jgi:hypothetical protein